MRKNTEIIEDLLFTVERSHGRIKQTHLMTKVNLSHKQLTSYLENLLEKGFVKKVNEKNNIYILITSEGTELAQKIREMHQFEKTFGL
ncbi:MAG: winged helix-turn-helix transcriptional regulator [Nanoarchaeota archaeon]|nr:winged helix-turn-helix transcriptional regulator [Nanoarchaeota archaeon]MBU1622079.1 winged helix-turn-helix transcriptional regulator [Nanoarchaeota archaeon]